MWRGNIGQNAPKCLILERRSPSAARLAASHRPPNIGQKERRNEEDRTGCLIFSPWPNR